MTAGAGSSTGSRHLLVLRHASAASAPGVADIERPLTERGEKDAALAGGWLRSAACAPDLVVCSTARRTRQTWDVVAAELPAPAEARYDARIYRNTLDDLLEVVRETEDGVRSLLLVSHNPAAQHLAVALTGDVPNEGFPTCAVAVIELTAPWSAVSEGTGRLLRFWSPPR